MTDSKADGPEPTWYGTAEPGPSDRPRSGLLALVVTAGDTPTCTIYPPDVAVPYRTTTWITAAGDSFVDPEAWR